MKNDLISIIVPVYNVEKYLNRCINSLVNQTYSNIEIILVDDGSTDNSAKICDDWAGKDSRIKVIHKNNGGVMSARNQGIQLSQGSYISFIDSDDWVVDIYIQSLFDIIIKYNCDVASGSFMTVTSEDIDVDSNCVSNEIVVDKEHIMKHMAQGLCYLWGKLYNRKLFNNIPEFNKNITVSEDMLVNYFLYKNCNKAVISDKVVYFYFRHSESVLSSNISYRMIDDSMLAYRIIDDDYDKNLSSYKDFIFNKVMNDYFLLNSVVRNNNCVDRYEILRGDILKYKKYIFGFKSYKIYGFRHMMGTFLLMFLPKLYNKSILVRKKIRGY